MSSVIGQDIFQGFTLFELEVMTTNKLAMNSSERDSISLSSIQDEPPRTFHVRPQDGASCRVILKTEESVKLEYPVQEEFDFIMGESESPFGDILEDNLRKLKPGEECSFDIPASKAGIDEEKDITLTVKLCQLENSIPVYQLLNEEKFEMARVYKEKGVELFKSGLLEYAFRRFSKALKFLILMQPKRDLPDSITVAYDTLKIQCYSNLAACQLKMHSYDYVVDNCTKALDIDPQNVKCIYRRAEAYFGLKKFDLCEKDVTEGLKIEPKSKTFKDLYRKIINVKQA